MKCLRLSESLGHGKMIVLFVRLAVFFKWPAPAASLVSCSTGVKPLRSLRGSRGVTTGIIISQAPLGVVKSTTARSEGRTAMRKLAMLKFLVASFYIRQIDGRGPEDMRRGPTFASGHMAFVNCLSSILPRMLAIFPVTGPVVSKGLWTSLSDWIGITSFDHANKDEFWDVFFLKHRRHRQRNCS